MEVGSIILLGEYIRRIYNPGHNILKLFDVLSNFLFTTCETKRRINNKHGV